MKCRFSTALGGMLAPGMKVNVRVDPRDPGHVLLVDDVMQLLSYRNKKYPVAEGRSAYSENNY